MSARVTTLRAFKSSKPLSERRDIRRRSRALPGGRLSVLVGTPTTVAGS
jgi:hypothetical protein